MQDTLKQIESFAVANNLALPGEPLLDGVIHRFSDARGTRANTDAWYIGHVFESGHAVFTMGTWKDQDVKYHWNSWGSKGLDPFVARQHREHHAAVRKHEAQQYEDAQKRAMKLWREAPQAPDDHPYLVSKKVRSHGLKSWNDNLVVPIVSSESGELVSLQFIGPKGEKRFLKG